MKLLVCGGCGFIGSEFIRNHLKKNSQDKIINLDSLTIGSNKANLQPIEKNENYSFVHDDIKNLDLVEKLTKDVDVIVNFAAETHVGAFQIQNHSLKPMLLAHTIFLKVLKKTTNYLFMSQLMKFMARQKTKNPLQKRIL